VFLIESFLLHSIVFFDIGVNLDFSASLSLFFFVFFFFVPFASFLIFLSYFFVVSSILLSVFSPLFCACVVDGVWWGLLN